MGSTETDICRRLVLEPLRKMFPGSRWTKIYGGVYATGELDVHGIVDGKAIWIETKKADNNKGNPTPQQRDALFEVARAGGVALVFVFWKDGRSWKVLARRLYRADGTISEVVRIEPTADGKGFGVWTI